MASTANRLAGVPGNACAWMVPISARSAPKREWMRRRESMRAKSVTCGPGRAMEPTEYVVIVEEGETSIGVYVPDLPGCVAVGESREEVLALIREAIELHLESLRDNGEPIPRPHSF